MPKEAVHADFLALMVKNGTARDFIVQRAIHHGIQKKGGWTLSVRQGARWLPVRSKRESVRVWAKLDTLEAFAVTLGITTLTVEL